VSRVRCLSHILCYFCVSCKVLQSHFMLFLYNVQGVYVTFYVIFLSRTRCLCHILCYLFISHKVSMSHFMLSLLSRMRFFVTVFFVSRTRCLSNILCYLVQGVYAIFYAIFVSGTGWLCHISCYLLSETTRSGTLDTPYTGVAGMFLHINESSQWGKSKSSLLSKSFVLSQFSLSVWRCRSRY